MSNQDQPNASAAPEGAPPAPVAPDAVLIEPSVRPTRPASARPAPRPRGGGTLALALLLALIAVGTSGYVGWR
ncbi:MAG: hypothetical protein ABIQ36_11990, partial [Rhodanobacter sp.]